jgi:hypothetical protein
MKRKKDLDPLLILERHPEWAHWTYDDLCAELCRLTAEAEDREQRRAQLYRKYGFLAPYDGALFASFWRRYSEDASLEQVMEAIRLKRRRGHKEQEALYIFDTYYADRDDAGWFAEPEEIDRLEALFEEQEEGREKTRGYCLEGAQGG